MLIFTNFNANGHYTTVDVLATFAAGILYYSIGSVCTDHIV